MKKKISTFRPPAGVGGGWRSGSYRKISFGFVFRTLENLEVPNFIKIWWKQKFRDFAPPPGPIVGVGGGGWRAPYLEFLNFFFIGHVLLLTPIFKPNLADLSRKKKKLAIFLWSFHYFEKGGFWGPLLEFFKNSKNIPRDRHIEAVYQVWIKSDD